MPNTNPDVGFDNGKLFVSWNGATNVTQWALATGSSADSLSEGTPFERIGFESNATFDASAGTYVAAVALNREGECLGVSPLYYTSNTTSSNITVACSQISGVQQAAASGDSDDSSAAVGQTHAAVLLATVAAMLFALVA